MVTKYKLLISDELGTSKKLLLENIFQLNMIKNIDDEIHMKSLIGQQEDKYISDEQVFYIFIFVFS